MKRAILYFGILYGLLIAGFISCKNNGTGESNSISTDVVHNPASASGKEDNEAIPVITFKSDNHDFGKIAEGEKVSYSFTFKNTGKADLLISSAKTTCGCTVPSYPKEPVAPGKEGVIEVSFDSNGKSGKVTKAVTLITNAIPNEKKLTITAEIQPN